MTRTIVIQLARLGDMLQSLPLCRSLRMDGELTLVLSFDPGRRLRQEADHIVVLDPGRTFREIRGVACLRTRLRDAWGAAPGWNGSVDRVICLNEDAAAKGLASLLPAVRRSGAGVPGDPYDRWLSVIAGRRGENQLQLAEAMMALSPGSESPAPLVLPGGAGDVILHMGSGSPARQLPTPFWRTLAEGLTANSDRRLVLTGSAGEASVCADLELHMANPGRIVSAGGATDLDGLQDLLDGAALVIAQDTGVLHLAAHLRRPLIGLYHGSASSRETAPWLDGAHVLQIREDCAPCIEGRPSCGDYRCRSSLDAADVTRLAISLLAGRPCMLEDNPRRAHAICRTDAGGVILSMADRGPDPAVVAERERQLSLVRQLGGEPPDSVAGRPAGRRLRLEYARLAGLDARRWRRREWPRPPASLVEEWCWRQETDALAPGIAGGGMPA